MTCVCHFKNLHKLNQILVLLVLAGVLAHLFALANTVFISLTYPYEHKDWFEWSMCLQTHLLAQGHNPYPMDPDHFTGVLYTFLMQLVLAPMIRWFGPQLWIGRLFSIFCFAASLGLIYFVLAKRLLLPQSLALLGVALGLVTQSLTQHTLQKFHPNSLALFLGMLAIACTPVRPEHRQRWWPPCFLALASFFTKQPGAVFLAAVFLAGLVQRQWRFVPVIAVTIAIGITIGIAMQKLTHGGFWFYCFQGMKAFRIQWNQVDDGLRWLVQGGFLYVIPSVYLLFSKGNWKNPLVTVVPFAIPVAVIGFAKLGGTPSSLVFGWLPLSASAVLGLQAFCEVINKDTTKHALSMLLIAVVLQVWTGLTKWPVVSEKDRKVTRHVEDLIRKTKGEVLCLIHDQEAFLARKPWYSNAEAIYMQNLAGIVSFPEIQKKIEERVFERIIINKSEYDLDAFQPKTLMLAMKKHYEIEEILESGRFGHPAYVLIKKVGKP